MKKENHEIVGVTKIELQGSFNVQSNREVDIAGILRTSPNNIKTDTTIHHNKYHVSLRTR